MTNEPGLTKMNFEAQRGLSPEVLRDRAIHEGAEQAASSNSLQELYERAARLRGVLGAFEGRSNEHQLALEIAELAIEKRQARDDIESFLPTDTQLFRIEQSEADRLEELARVLRDKKSAVSVPAEKETHNRTPSLQEYFGVEVYTASEITTEEGTDVIAQLDDNARERYFAYLYKEDITITKYTPCSEQQSTDHPEPLGKPRLAARDLMANTPSKKEPIDQTSVFSGINLPPALTSKKSKKRTAIQRSALTTASVASRIIPKTRKKQVFSAAGLALAIGGGAALLATDAPREGLIAECVDESYAGDTIASTTLDAQSSIEWSLMNRDDGPVMRVGEDGKQLPKLTVQGVSVDLEICAVDGKSISESDGTVSIDAGNLVARAVINSSEATSNWQSIDRALLENAAKSEILSAREAAGYISSMGDKNNVTKATGVTANELAIQIESDKAMLDKDTSVNAALVDLAVKGLKQRVAQSERELVIDGDVNGVALDFTNTAEDQGTQINFDETETKIEISKSMVTGLHPEGDEEQKEKKEK